MRTSPNLVSRNGVALVFFSALVSTHSFASVKHEGEWLNWRGPNQNGSTSAGTYPTKWNVQKVLWKSELPGKGTSVPIVQDEKIFLTSPLDDEDAVLAFDLNGRALWQTKLGPADPPKHRSLASSCNASPVSDGKGLFVYFKSGNFAALELDGKVRWKINLVEQFGRDQLFWDQGTSPVVTDKFVIMTRMHGGDSWIAAFDKKNGELRWREKRNFSVPAENDNGYTTPVLIEHQGKQILLVWGADHLTAHSAENGKVLWTCGGFNPEGTGYWPAIASPVVVGEVVVVPAGRDDRGQASLYGIKLGGSGDVTETHRVWKRADTGVFVASPAVYKGRVYLLRHRGEIVCLDPATGSTLWTEKLPEHRAPYYASPVIANGILYAAREDGVVFSVRVEDKPEYIDGSPMDERIIATPVPVSNRLLIRGDRHLFCVAGE